MRRKDRSTIEFPDPFPGLEHEMAEVNGIRCVYACGSISSVFTNLNRGNVAIHDYDNLLWLEVFCSASRGSTPTMFRVVGKVDSISLEAKLCAYYAMVHHRQWLLCSSAVPADVYIASLPSAGSTWW